LVQAKASGYQVILVMIHLGSPQLNQARIAMRVSEGGHNVPAAKVEGRIARMLKQVKVVLPLCDLVQLYDNSSAEHPFQPIATLEQGYCRPHSASLPPWAASLLAF
jgi:predicted ABC-type ATPase